MDTTANPLRQFFRRPAIHFRLPSGGKGYSPADLVMPENNELPVYPMTAIDDITVKTPDALFNGAAVADLIKSCVPNIKNPWAIQSSDLDAILICIKVASQGSTIEVEDQCPKCEEISTYGASLLDMLSKLKAADYDKELPIGDLSIKFKPLTYAEMNEANLAQFELQKVLSNLTRMENEEERTKQGAEIIKSITHTTMVILAKTISYVKTPNLVVEEFDYILDFLKNCDNNSFTAIRDYHTALKAEADIKPLHVKCPHCGHEHDQPFTLNASSFFG